MLRLIAIAGGFVLGAYCASRYARQAQPTPPKRTVKEQVSTWENEGGNVPSVPTPRPSTNYLPGTQ